MKGIDPEFARISSVLDALSLRQQAIAANLANASTPGYRRRIVDFEEVLRAAREPFEPKIEEDPSPPLPHGNNVDAMRELTDLEKTEILYETLARGLALKASWLRLAVSGGR